MDRTDYKILAILQEDASLPVAEVASRVNLSQTPCWRRIQRLERDGLIRRRVALLDRDKLNCGTTAFMMIRTNDHSIEWLASFHKAVAELPEVVDFHRLSGDIDYLLRVVVPDMKAYDAFYKRLISRIRLHDVSSMFSMEELKSSSELPLDYLILN